MQKFLSNQNKLFLSLSIIILQVFLLKPIQVLADLPTGNAVKDPNAILRNALPIKQVELQEIQHKLEETSDLVRGGRWPALTKTVTKCQSLLKKKVGLFGAPALAGLIYLIPFPNLPVNAHVLASILVWVVVSWITEALPLAVTSFLGAAFCVVAGLGTAEAVFSAFAHPIIFLFIGSFFLAEAFVVHKVDRRFAVWLLSLKWVNSRPASLFLAMALALSLIHI